MAKPISKFDLSFANSGLSPDNISKAQLSCEATTIGKAHLKYLAEKAVVTIYYLGTTADLARITGAADADGYCHPVFLGKQYNVYVVAGDRKTTFQIGDIDKTSVVNKDSKEIARILFHELSHARFMTEYPNQGTGHEAGAGESSFLNAQVTYNVSLYDQRFLAWIQAFENQV